MQQTRIWAGVLIRSVQVSTPSLMHVFVWHPSGSPRTFPLGPFPHWRPLGVPATFPPGPAPTFASPVHPFPPPPVPARPTPNSPMALPFPILCLQFPLLPCPCRACSHLGMELHGPLLALPQALGFMNIYFIYIYIVYSCILITKYKGCKPT